MHEKDTKFSRIEDLENDIERFQEQQNINNKVVRKTNNSFSFIYTIFCDILGGVIVSFILYKMYKHFFGKNVIVFSILLFGCIIGGLYNSIKLFIKHK